MKVTKYQPSDERSILTAMIVNDRVLSKIYVSLKKSPKGPFRSKWSNIIAKWCLSYFSKYQKAPRHSIQTLFKDFAETSNDEDTIVLLEKFLSSLSEDYKALSKELNEDFALDVAARHFNEIRMERLCQSVEADLIKKDTTSAQAHITEFSAIALGSQNFVDVFSDVESIKDALIDAENDVLVRFPGALGEFFGAQFSRDSLVAFLAPEKRGKSFWLIDIAWRAAVREHRRVLFYSVGDMSQRQMMRRFITRTARRPLKAGAIQKPRGIRKAGEEKAKVKLEEIPFKDDLNFAEAKRTMVDEIKSKTAHSTSLLKLKCTSVSTTSVKNIATDIDELIHQGWIADIVVIDYADILLMEGEEERHKHNNTWKDLRKLSLDYHICVVTATQADADSYERETIRRKNFSEDKRKYGHVTAFAGINQTEEEKSQGIYRLNWIMLRDGIYFESKCVTVAGCLSISNPAIVSTW